jgi:hypothetical protein
MCKYRLGMFVLVLEVRDQTEEQVAKLGGQKYARLLQHAATFAENQFGQRTAATSSYSRDDVDHVVNWEVELVLLFKIYNKLCYYTSSNAISYSLKTLAILEAWII